MMEGVKQLQNPAAGTGSWASPAVGGDGGARPAFYQWEAGKV